MIDAKSRRPSGARRNALLNGAAATCDDEAQFAAALRVSDRSADDVPARPKQRRLRRPAGDRPETPASRVAAEIGDAVEARLPGRIRDLEVRAEEDQFVLTGESSSYYVKQVAQHVAMNALNSLMLGRLVNEIKVHAVR